MLTVDTGTLGTWNNEELFTLHPDGSASAKPGAACVIDASTSTIRTKPLPGVEFPRRMGVWNIQVDVSLLR